MTEIVYNPDTLFIQDIIADDTLAPQLSDPLRIHTIKVYLKGEGPTDHTPDIRTPRTDVYILAWEDRANHTLPPWEERT